MVLYTFISQCSSFYFFSLFFWSPFQCSFLSLYTSTSITSSPSISTSPHSFFDTLLPFTFKEDSGRNLLICGLHCSGHFLINTVDKAIVYHLIQMQQATPGQKLPYCPLTSTSFRSELPLRIPQNTMIHFFSSSSGFFPWACGLQYFHVSTATFQLPSWSSGQCCNPSTSSSVIKHPQ